MPDQTTTPAATASVWKNPGVLAAGISVIALAAGFFGYRIEAADQAAMLQNVLAGVAAVTSLISLVKHVFDHKA
jgi:hypothetical protein